MKKVVHAACPHDCPDACGVLITVENGLATKIQGDPAHPITRGFLCGKVAKYLDRVYSPERVLYPMRRVLPKGPQAEAGNSTRTGSTAALQRITWDEAFDEITVRFKTIIEEFGSEAILPYSYGGTLAVLNGASMDRRFFHRLGASQLDRTICSTAGEEGLKSVIGVKLGTEPEQFRDSRYIIAWGANIHANNVHLWPFIAEARRSGAKLAVIDPYRTRTAKCADWYLPINPGTDAALALAMMHVIINEGLFDGDYVAKYTLGFEQLCAKVQEYPPERAAQWLPCITGSWKEVGGGLQLSTSGAYGLNREALQGENLMQESLGRPARVVNMVELGKALNTLDKPPLQALFVYNSNPAAVCPNHNDVVRGLRRSDLFTVVHEQFLTDTTDYADIVLPATTFFEHKDLQTAYGHYYLQISDQAIEPLGECRSNVEVFRGLAQRMGFQEDCFRETADDMIDLALHSDDPWLEGIDRERLAREKHVRLNFDVAGQPKASFEKAKAACKGSRTTQESPFLPFAHGDFRTSSGKAELYNERLKAQGLDPVASFLPPSESRHGKHAKSFPLELLARKADNFLNSTFSNLPSIQQMEEPSLLELNSADARARGIADGDMVRVFNQRGEILLKARVDGAVQPGVVSAHLNWAKLTPGRRNINVLTSEKLTDMGNSATFYSVLVEVELKKPAD